MEVRFFSEIFGRPNFHKPPPPPSWNVRNLKTTPLPICRTSFVDGPLVRLVCKIPLFASAPSLAPDDIVSCIQRNNNLNLCFYYMKCLKHRETLYSMYDHNSPLILFQIELRSKGAPELYALGLPRLHFGTV